MTTQRDQALTSAGLALLLAGTTVGGLRLIGVIGSTTVDELPLVLLALGALLITVGQRRRWDSSSAELASDTELADEVQARFRDDAPRAMRTLAGYADRVDRASLLSAVHRSNGDLGRLRGRLDEHLLREEP